MDEIKVSSPEEMATFYLSINTVGKCHWEYMNPDRMRHLFEQLLMLMRDKDSKTAQRVKLWLS